MKLLDTITFSNQNQVKPTNYFESIGAFNYDYIYLRHKSQVIDVYKVHNIIILTKDLIIGDATGISIFYDNKAFSYNNNYNNNNGGWQFTRDSNSDTSNIIEIYGIQL